MNKKYAFLIILGIALIVGIVAFIYFKNVNNSSNLGEANYNSTRTAQNISDNTNSENTENIENTEANTTHNTTAEENTAESNKETKPATEPPKETEIASFTTKIYTKDSGRQNNVKIACSTLNDTIVENGKTFSFSNTVGKATSSKGYKKADVFRNGEVIEALGGRTMSS